MRKLVCCLSIVIPFFLFTSIAAQDPSPTRDPNLQWYDVCSTGGWELEDDKRHVKFKDGYPVPDPSVKTPDARMTIVFFPGISVNGQFQEQVWVDKPYGGSDAAMIFKIDRGMKFPMWPNPTKGAWGENPDYEKALTTFEIPRDGWRAYVAYMGPSYNGGPITLPYLDHPIPSNLENPPYPQGRRDGPIRLSTSPEGFPSMSFKDMTPGFYVVTLENDIKGDGRTCPKNTPPIMIEVRHEEPIKEPKISIRVKPECGTDLVATAEAHNQNIPPSSLYIKWEAWDQNRKPVDGEQGDGSKSFRIAKAKLRNGEIYHFKVTVTNEHGKIAYAEDEKLYACDGAAGVIYFGFAIPYSGEGTKYPKPVEEPESWVKGNAPDEQSKPYPDHPFTEFYRRPGIETDVPNTVETNTATIKRIVNVLSMPEKKFNIWLYGYADYEKKAQKFSNQQLSEDRFRQVQRAIEAAYNRQYPNDPLDIDRVKGKGILLGLSDKNAARCPQQKRYDDIQRWDRRTEIVFMEEYRSVSFQTEPSRCLSVDANSQPPPKPRRTGRRP